MKTDNRGFGAVQMLLSLVIICVLGIVLFKSYFAVSNKSSAEAEKLYESAAPQASMQAAGNAPQSADSNIQRAKELEGKVFMANIINAEKTYQAANGSYSYSGWTQSMGEIGVDSSGNQYFKDFAVEKTADGGFIVKVKGSGALQDVELVSEPQQ